MSDSACADSATVTRYKTRLLEHLRKRPRDNLALGDLRDTKNKALQIAAMQLVKEQAPRLELVEFGTSMTLCWKISLDRLSPESLASMRQDQMILDAAFLDALGDELPDAPGIPQVRPEPEGGV